MKSRIQEIVTVVFFLVGYVSADPVEITDDSINIRHFELGYLGQNQYS
ncbi:MAG: hypothetical protein P8X79_16870 [Reinekea sp.]